ncbi:MAG: MBL fold metallo-hydrolase, partial [archaeon]|nr:MBL fold metallo-hydrolase [archaeon]
MQISWKGQACFHIIASPAKGEQVKIVIDPYDNSLGLKLPALEADVALVTHDHYDHNNVKGLKGDPFVVNREAEPGDTKAGDTESEALKA